MRNALTIGFVRAFAIRNGRVLVRRFTDNYKWFEVRESAPWTLFLCGDLYASVRLLLGAQSPLQTDVRPGALHRTLFTFE